jgi:hypothetical protein
MNRIGASRLQQIAGALQVPVTFFFETTSPHPPVAEDQSLETLNRFMTSRDGLKLAKSFMRIGDIQLRRRIVDLVETIERDRDYSFIQKKPLTLLWPWMLRGLAPGTRVAATLAFVLTKAGPGLRPQSATRASADHPSLVRGD